MIYKYALIKFIVLLAFSSFAQSKPFELNGRIIGIDSGFISIVSSKLDSSLHIPLHKVPVMNEKFIIKGHLDYPTQVIVTFHSGNNETQSGWIFIDSGNQSIVVKPFKEYLEVSSTSARFREAMNFSKELASIKPSNDSIEKENIKEAFGNLKDSFLVEYIKQKPNSYVGLSYLYSSMIKNGYLPIYETGFNYLEDELKTRPIGKEINKRIINTRNFKIGSKFPKLQLRDTNSSMFTLNQLISKEYILIDFWFHNCGSCILQFPMMNEIYKKWSQKGFGIIGISTDLSRFEAEWKKAILKNSLSWPQFWDVNGLQSSELLINFFPTNFLIDKDGNIIAKNIELNDLDEFLATKFK